VTGHPSDTYFDDKAEIGQWKDAKVDEEDGEFGETLDERIEDLSGIIELKMSFYYAQKNEVYRVPLV
jgi:hypothetical protein